MYAFGELVPQDCTECTENRMAQVEKGLPRSAYNLAAD